ncbi:M15 family metallopeptidase [Nocardioides daeguensis]|uniref:M15 family metallopeptidase n=1 Tax=Nocardioides daeguensis TaxID=908359 RepID=A0ABP6W6I8_9ACTN|nr:M15 family metallopeptidase [Nocardioides daeguensis]MBV6727705.1 M15 family metallopeptidase [Nocardioides daeguensis]MCR1775177.1 M15 family metallopeptidase [Nocardioides daeguensis]
MTRGAGLLVVAALLPVLAAGCSGRTPAAPVPPVPPAPPASSQAGSSPADPDASAIPGPSYSTWELGVHVLPRTPAGFGEVRPTPKALRVRRYPTTDLLPPPADGAFHASVGPVTDAIRERMGETWSPACPVALADLAYVTVSFRGFDHRAHTGELVLAAAEAEDVVSVFRALFAAGFPIEEMRLPTTADLDAPPTGDGNDTAALVCRAARGQTSWSAHAYGLAIDVNPFLNPYSLGDVVLPERASAYLDRSRTQPGIIHAGDLVVREFARIGWSWGGAWSSLKDYQHFTATGR